jgi:hypothetical protein
MHFSCGFPCEQTTHVFFLQTLVTTRQGWISPPKSIYPIGEKPLKWGLNKCTPHKNVPSFMPCSLVLSLLLAVLMILSFSPLQMHTVVLSATPLAAVLEETRSVAPAVTPSEGATPSVVPVVIRMLHYTHASKLC